RDSAAWPVQGEADSSPCQIIWRDNVMDTAEVFSAISRAISMALASTWSSATTWFAKPADSASSAPTSRPVITHSMALPGETTRGRYQVDAASGTNARRLNTNPYRVDSPTIRTSIGSVIVAP